MGVVHKLKPEVLSFIIENKQNNPSLSCRNLTSLISEQFHIEISKSSINAIFKANNLSMPIGRRQKQKKRKFNMPALPVIEGVKAITLVAQPSQSVQEQVVNASLPVAESGQVSTKNEITASTPCLPVAKECSDNDKNDSESTKTDEAVNEKLVLEEKRIAEEKRIKEAEEWAMKLQEEERIRIEEKLRLEKQRLKDEDTKIKSEEAEIKAHLEVVARLKAEDEARKRVLEETRQAAAQAAAESKRLEEESRKLEEAKAAQEAAENKQREETARKLEEEKAVQEAALKAEKERLAKLAEEEQRSKQAEDEARKRALEEALQAAENKRLEEETRKLEEEKAAQEAALKAEKEKWAKLAEEEQRSKQQVAKKEETILPKAEFVVSEALLEDRNCLGAIMLKALDCLLGGSKGINAVISRGIKGKPEDSLNLTEALIFKSIFSKDDFSALGDLIGVQYSKDKLNNYYAQIKQITDIGSDTAKIISNVFTEAKGVKVHFIDGSIIHLDGQLHSSWPATRFPGDFSNTVYSLKNNLNKHFLQGIPLVLLAPPGYEILPKDFFNLLLNLGSKDNYPDSLALFGNQLETLDKISLTSENRCVLVFGLWPWQFTSSRKVKRIGDFSLKHIQEIDRDLYLGEIEIDLFRASSNQILSFKGCAVKTDLKEKISLVILNSAEQVMSLDELAGIYLSRWSNFEEAFQDFSRKIELFTYASTEQKFFSGNSFGTNTAGSAMELSEIFVNYIKILDAYLRWHFLPAGYTEKDFSSTSEYFYKLPVKLIASQSRIRARTLVSQDYRFLKDLEYLHCRLNERQINTTNGKMFWFESAFK
jgi:hypothetical protein